MPDVTWDMVAAAHEAGHVAVALEHNIPIVTVTIRSDMPNRGGHVFLGEYHLRGMRAAERFSMMLLAGREAERLFFAEPLPEGGDEDDLQKVRQVLMSGRPAYVEQSDGVFAPAERFLPERIERLRRRTRRLIRTPIVRWQIHMVRSALLERHTLTVAELAKVTGRLR